MVDTHRRAHGKAARLAAAAALLLGALAALGGGCNGGQRFPVCNSNAECAADNPAAPVCYNLKCVECRYDVDCAGGKICSAGHRCEAMRSSAPPPPDTGPVKWEAGSWDECARDCKDQACIKACDEKFKK